MNIIITSVFLGLVIGLAGGASFCYNCSVTNQDFRDLGERIQGDVYLPGGVSYEKGRVALNTLYTLSPRAVVYVESSEDVSEVLRFCTRHGLRPTVKSSGHDYIGRSSGSGSVNINMAKMVATNVRTTADGAVIDVEPAINMSGIYHTVHQHGYVFVGGSAPTVASGGWATGGGHSPMSRKFGLGVDNTLGFTIVTADGSIIKLTSTGGTIRRAGETTAEAYDTDQAAELFWAVRGGGGGTFGIITSFTFKLYPAPTDGFTRLLLIAPIVHPDGRRTGDDVLKRFTDYFASGSMSANWGGYLVTSSYTGFIDEHGTWANGLLTFTLLHVGGYETAKTDIDEFLSWPANLFYWRKNISYPSFLDYTLTINDPTGFRTRIANRLLQEADLQNADNLVKVITKTVDIAAEYSHRFAIGCTWTLLGGNMRQFAVDSSAVSADFRNSVGSYSCGVGWGEAQHDDFFDDIMARYSRDMNTVGKGVYLNEPYIDLPNYKTDYWGSMENYNRLLAVKQRVDPDYLFWCRNCVASDLMDDPFGDTASSLYPVRSLVMGMVIILSLVIYT